MFPRDKKSLKMQLIPITPSCVLYIRNVRDCKEKGAGAGYMFLHPPGTLTHTTLSTITKNLLVIPTVLTGIKKTRQNITLF